MMTKDNKKQIYVGLHDDHNSGIGAIRGDDVILYCEFERVTRVKNQSGQLPQRVAQILGQLPLEEVAAISAPDPDFAKYVLTKYFGGVSVGTGQVSVGGHPISIYDQEELHPLLHILAALPLTDIRPNVYAVLVFDADQPRVGWIDLREPLTAPPDLHLRTVSDQRWFNGELFSDLYGKMFYGSQNLSHCGKLMGLSSWGRTRVRHLEWLEMTARRHFDPNPVTWKGYRGADPSRLVVEATAFLGVDPRTHTHPDVIDLAAAAQELFTHNLTEQVVVGVAQVQAELAQRGLPAATGVIYGGGCALSVVSNAVLRERVGLPFIIPPYSHDSSQFLGGAVWASLHEGKHPFRCGGWGTIPAHSVGVVRVGQLEEYGVEGRAAEPDEIAKRILDGELFGLIEGGAEAGPRALGKRSLLANALDPSMRDRINFEVKRREWYRPFAPAFPAEVFERYFGTPASPAARYMLDAYRVVPEYRSVLASVTSPDGTARAQAVHSDVSPFYYSVLQAIGKRAGHPVAMNTSLNAPGLTIAFDLVQSITDCQALGLNAAIVDGVLVESRMFPQIVGK